MKEGDLAFFYHRCVRGVVMMAMVLAVSMAVLLPAMLLLLLVVFCGAACAARPSFCRFPIPVTNGERGGGAALRKHSSRTPSCFSAPRSSRSRTTPQNPIST